MNKRILVIDDDLYIRELYEEVLINTGYEVETAIGGEEGIEKLNKGGFDLILLDMMMPEINGLTILNEISQKPPSVKNGPIILLSNLGEDQIIEEALKKGAAAYMTKSDATPDQLLKTIKKYLN